MSTSATAFSFPHPVLWHNDDVGGPAAAVVLTCKLSEQLVSVRIADVYTGNKTIDGLVAEGRAAWTARFSCQRTYVRRELVLSAGSAAVDFIATDLWGRVNVELAVIALERMPNYRPDALHEDYGDSTTFIVEPGAFLAQVPEMNFPVDKEFDALRSPAASLIRIGEGSDQVGPMTVEYGDWIHVRLCKDDWAHWTHLTERQNFIHAAIALPVLVAAIQLVRAEGPRDSEALRRLEDKLQAANLAAESDPLVTAQSLLALPLQRAIEEHIAERGGGDNE